MQKDKTNLVGQIAQVTIHVDVALRNYMKILAIQTDVSVAQLWQEAGIQFLESKGIILKPIPSQAEPALEENRKTA